MPSTIGIVASALSSPMQFSPALWLDASDSTTITSSGSPATVSQWNDKSGNGRNVTQATAAAQPTTGSATLNGLNVLTFDSNDTLATAAFTLAQPMTFFVVAKRTTPSGNEQMIGTPTAVYSDGASPTWRLFAGTVLDSGTGTNTNWNLFRAVFNGSSSSLHLNGSSIASGNAGSSGYSNAALFVSGNAAANRAPGDYAEIILFGSALSADNATTVEAYLNAKWGL